MPIVLIIVIKRVSVRFYSTPFCLLIKAKPVLTIKGQTYFSNCTTKSRFRQPASKNNNYWKWILYLNKKYKIRPLVDYTALHANVYMVTNMYTKGLSMKIMVGSCGQHVFLTLRWFIDGDFDSVKVLNVLNFLNFMSTASTVIKSQKLHSNLINFFLDWIILK